MRTDNVIKIEDAQELRELGFPILPIVDLSFSKAAETLFAEANKAESKFYRALAEYHTAPTPTEPMFNRLRKALDKIIGICNRAANFTSDQEGEAEAVQVLLTAMMTEFVACWKPILATINEGKPATITITEGMQDGWGTS